MIMYVCDPCSENDPESCGHSHRDELRVAPSGEWMCDNCYEYADHEENEPIPWSDLPLPPEYKAVEENAEKRIVEKNAEIDRLKEWNEKLKTCLDASDEAYGIDIKNKDAEIERLQRRISDLTRDCIYGHKQLITDLISAVHRAWNGTYEFAELKALEERAKELGSHDQSSRS